MRPNNPITNFEKFVLRSPLFSLNFFFDLTKNETIEDNHFLRLFNDPIIKEAIYNSSPNLYQSILNWESGEKIGKKSIEKTKLSFFKYLTRMSTRCTPFGLLAGFSVGSISDTTDIVKADIHNHRKYSRVDHEVLIRVSNKILGIDKIKQRLKFYPNTSIYFLKDEIRYIETIYLQHLRDHKIVSVKKTSVLLQVLELCENGCIYDDLLEKFNDYDIPETFIKQYIDGLIANQVLVSELEPNNIGEEYLDRLIGIMKRLGNIDIGLNELKTSLNLLDSKMGTSIDVYRKIEKKLNQYFEEPSSQNGLRTDLDMEYDSITLDYKHMAKIIEGVIFLNKLSMDPYKPVFSDFKREFEKRYGERKVSINKVMDTEMGIGFLQDSTNQSINESIDDIDIPINAKRYFFKETFSRGHVSFFEKISGIENERIVKFSYSDLNSQDKDWHSYSNRWENINDTSSAFVEIVSEDGIEKYIIQGVYGPSATTFLSRFSFANEEIYELVKEITNYEKNIEPDSILVEVSYLPKKATGGVNLKRDIRNYELPYLTFSNKTNNEKILAKDLYIYVKNNEIKIWCNRLKRHIIPKVSDAHYHEYGSLPIYHFLNEIQIQNKRIVTSFYLNKFISRSMYLPRVEFKNVIFSLARWRIKVSEIQDLINENLDEILLSKMKVLKSKLNLPDIVKLTQSDSVFVINLNNIWSIKSLFSIVKNHYDFILSEFLHSPNDGLVKNEKGEVFANEFIFPLHKTKLDE